VVVERSSYSLSATGVVLVPSVPWACSLSRCQPPSFHSQFGRDFKQMGRELRVIEGHSLRRRKDVDSTLGGCWGASRVWLLLSEVTFSVADLLCSSPASTCWRDVGYCRSTDGENWSGPGLRGQWATGKRMNCYAHGSLKWKIAGS